eukprot:jgi/Psemu1/328579/estExt_fgenesh1_pg.C_16240001
MGMGMRMRKRARTRTPTRKVGDESSDNGESTNGESSDESYMETEDCALESSDDESEDIKHQSSDRGLEVTGIVTNGASESFPSDKVGDESSDNGESTNGELSDESYMETEDCALESSDDGSEDIKHQSSDRGLEVTGIVTNGASESFPSDKVGDESSDNGESTNGELSDESYMETEDCALESSDDGSEDIKHQSSDRGLEVTGIVTNGASESFPSDKVGDESSDNGESTNGELSDESYMETEDCALESSDDGSEDIKHQSSDRGLEVTGIVTNGASESFPSDKVGDESSNNGESTNGESSDESYMETEDCALESSDDESEDIEHQSSNRGLEVTGIVTNGASESFPSDKALRDTRWKAKFQLLVHYKTRTGRQTFLTAILPSEFGSRVNAKYSREARCQRRESLSSNPLVLIGYKADPKLGKWVNIQRQYCKQKDRTDRLNKIGFVWGCDEEKRRQWEVMYQRLVAYKNAHGTTLVPSKYKADPKLGTWVQNQRQYCKQKDRMDRLNEIGFVWDCDEEKRHQWEVMYQRLVAYKNAHGTTLVSQRYKADPKLGAWVQTQRYECKQKDRMDRLNKIGFVCNFTEESSKNWETMFRRLVAYRRKHQTTCVPTKYKADRKLALWVTRQRQHCRKQERVDLLNDIGFAWNPKRVHDEKWEVMYQRLVDYKNKHNTTCVPKKYKADRKLAPWVAHQRQCCQKQDRVDRLNSIGFEWNPKEVYDEKWEIMYQRLVDYKNKHNTTCVRQKDGADLPLINWVSTQRRTCKRKDRIDRLNAIGFVWDTRKQTGSATMPDAM